MNKRINMIGEYLKEEFGEKIVKLALDGNFTCPNRDGSKGTGGCIFCSADGSGDFAGTISSQIKLLSDKWPNAKYIAYFQNHTNTYAPAEELKQKYLAALDGHPDIIGLAIATRPDCISEEVYELLAELNKRTFLWVELGLQSAHDKTGETINRCHPVALYDEAVKKLASLGIRTVTHLILGLPSYIKPAVYDEAGNLLEDAVVIPETREEMLDSVRHVSAPVGYNATTGSDRIFGIKLHMLNIVRGSQMEKLCPNYVPFDTIGDYTELAVEAICTIPKEITLHRISADAPRPILIAPEWSFKKRTILNEIHKKMADRNLCQGQNAEL